MHKQAIHKDLSTSFVDVEALVGYLRELQFVGSVHIELSDYDADIIFTRSHRLQARECDHAAGTVDQGRKAFRRILERAREPRGRIHIYQAASGENSPLKIHIDAAISARAKATFLGVSDCRAPLSKVSRETRSDWDELLNLTAELLRIIDRSLENEGIDFGDAFSNACALVADDFPFIDPLCGLFEYRGGHIRVGTQVSKKRFLDAIFSAVARVFERLRELSSLGRVRLLTTLDIKALTARRVEAYRKFDLDARIAKLLQR